MNKSIVVATLLALPLLVAATGETLAWSKAGFPGTRDQVRAACAAVGGDLMEGQGQTHCFNDANGTSVSCYDDGTCDGGGPGPAPRIRVGMANTVGAAIGKMALADKPVPESLTSGNSDSAAAAGPAGSAGPGYDIGQWHAGGKQGTWQVIE